MELFDAYVSNTVLPIEHVSDFVTTHLKETVFAQWKKIQYKPKYLIELFEKLTTRQLFDQEIWEKLFESLKRPKAVKRLEDFALLHTNLLKLQESGAFFRDLTDEVAFWSEKITTNHDHYTRYNIEEQRFFTFEEMKAKREENNFPDQMYKIYFDPKYDQVDDMSKLSEEERKQAIAMQEEKARDVTFDDIVNQRIASLKKGDLLSPFQDLLQDDESKEVVAEYEEDEEGEDAEISEATKRETAKALKQRMNTDKKLRKQIMKEKKPKEAE